jgi:hypothetical protein
MVTPRFFLHWYWRIRAQLGSADAWLGAGNLPAARLEAGGLLESALATADPNLHALAWEMNARIAVAEENWGRAESCIERALALAETFGIPATAWQVHRTAWDIYGNANDLDAAQGHRLHARELILSIADSFEPGEPLRETFLAGAPVARILNADL